jgi:hypothetical protein
MGAPVQPGQPRLVPFGEGLPLRKGKERDAEPALFYRIVPRTITFPSYHSADVKRTGSNSAR